MKHFTPATTIIWSEVQKFRRKKYFAIASILALIGAFFITKTILETNQKNEIKNILVASKTLEGPMLLTTDDVETKNFPLHLLPDNYVKNESDLVNNTLIKKVNKNEIFVYDDINQKIDPNSITANMPPSSKSLVIPEAWLESPIPNLSNDDVIDIIISQATRNNSNTKIIASKLKIIQTPEISKSQKNYIIVLITEDDAKNIMYAHSLNVPMNIIINSRE